MSSSLYLNDALNLVPSTDELVARVVDVIKVHALTPEQALARLLCGNGATVAHLLLAAIIVLRDQDQSIDKLEDQLNACEKEHDALLDEIADLEARVGAKR